MVFRRALCVVGMLALPSVASARPTCPETFVLKTVCSTVLDVETDARVRAHLLRLNSADTLTVRVDVSDGVVSLSGSVTSEEARARVEAAVRQVSGVTRVQNNISVVPPAVDVASL